MLDSLHVYRRMGTREHEGLPKALKPPKKSCPAGYFDENSSNNLTIDVGTHPGGWEDHRRSYKLETTSSDCRTAILMPRGQGLRRPVAGQDKTLAPSKEDRIHVHAHPP